MALTAKREAFCQAMALSGGEKVNSYKKAGYSWQNMSQTTLSNEAEKLSKVPDVSRRIQELTKKAVKKAEEKFSISFETRLKYLDDIVQAGMAEYDNGQGVMRRESLAAAKGAVDSMNSMLAPLDGGGNDSSEIHTIQIQVVK